MSTCENSVNLIFDLIAALISVSDVATDVVVTYNFYQNSHMVFFGLSLTFIILAQFSYIFAFIIVIGYEDKPYKAFLMFLCLLPISPLLSFVFYLTEDPNSMTSDLLKNYFCFKVHLSDTYVDSTKSKLKQWMKKKLRKHLGFIMESCIEAFPQSIIQISAIVVYNNADIISIVSILISMLSVSSKAFIFSIQFSINIKSLLFIWICCVTDFIGVFFSISWVLYNTDHETISTLAFMWQLKILICVMPLVFCCSVWMYVNGMEELLNAMVTSSKIAKIFGAVCAFLMVQILWCFGMVLGTMALEIATFITWTPPIMLSCDRVPQFADSQKQFLDLIDWIRNARSQKVDNALSFTKKQDIIIRTCCANKVIMDSGHSCDKKLRELITENERNCFMEIKSLTQLRTTYIKRSFYDEDWTEFWQVFLALLLVPHIIAHNEAKYVRNETKRKIVIYGVGFANFGIGPFYYLSRIFNMVFPFMILINLYIDGYNIFDKNDVAPFQCIMLLLYLFFIFILIILAIVVYYEHYYLWHIIPGRNLSNSLSIILKTVEKKYYKLVSIPVRNALLNAKYGRDIAKIIVYYCDAIQVDDNQIEEEINLLCSQEEYTNIV